MLYGDYTGTIFPYSLRRTNKWIEHRVYGEVIMVLRDYRFYLPKGTILFWLRRGRAPRGPYTRASMS